jgi:hypothetical protein
LTSDSADAIARVAWSTRCFGDLQRCARRVVLTLTENVSDDVPLDSLATNDVERAVGRAAVENHVLKVIKILL